MCATPTALLTLATAPFIGSFLDIMPLQVVATTSPRVREAFQGCLTDLRHLHEELREHSAAAGLDALEAQDDAERQRREDIRDGLQALRDMDLTDSEASAGSDFRSRIL